jgi:endonuclease/exonuclease/phosphatase family metal-dependent hydrolase
VASHNIKFLKTTVTEQGDRLQKLREVIELLDADIIELQEIDNRAARPQRRTARGVALSSYSNRTGWT